MNEKLFDKKIQITTTDLASVLGVTLDMVGELERTGGIKRVGRGRWNAWETFTGLLKHYRSQRDKAKAKGQTKTLDEAKLKKIAVDTKMAELRYAVASGEMHPSEVVAKVYSNREARVAAKLKQVRQNCSKLCEGRNVEEIDAILGEEHDSILREFDAIDQKTLLKLNKQYLGRMVAEEKVDEVSDP